MKIGIIGIGHIGTAIIRGLVKSGKCSSGDIYIKSGRSKNAKELSKEIEANIVENIEDMKKCDIILFSTPSKHTLNMIKEVKNYLDSNNTLISLAGGITITDIEKVIGPDIPVACLIPNVGVEVNNGILAFTPNNLVDKEKIKTLFNGVGKVFEVPEKELDIFTTISGCGPAFVDVFIDALSDAATLNGMDRKLSYEVITEMILGSANLYKQTNKHIGALKDEVTSPGGSTIKGIAALEKNNFRYSLIDAINSVEHK